MIFAPHILQVKVITEEERDEFGRPVPNTGGECWKDVCKCRCDDNTTKEFKSENGLVYRPDYHVVCEGQHKLTVGSYCRCLDKTGDVRGEGEIYIPKSLNYLNYSELWM